MTSRVGRAFVVLGLALTSLALATTSASADQAPYQDPAAQGTITLCDQDLQPITSGPVTDRPTFWRAVGSQAAPDPYNTDRGKATLALFQPRPGVRPGGWSGTVMTAASTYADPDHPMAQSSWIDFPLSTRLAAFPPRWNGWMQLRLLYTATNAPPSAVYAAANLRIEGQRWTLVGGGNDDCGSPADATSPEVALPNYSKSARAIQQQQAGQSATAKPSAGTSSAPNGSPSPTPAAGGPTGTSGGGVAADDSSALPWVVGALVLVVAALLLSALAWSRRRGPSGQHR